ncbi:MAG: class I SAM-dependent methyltransferase [Cyclobacteriaceae bacterium]|nr:class I SAM-dependent methyltransferase [Cyclobacteriaceae bacterium HetDA_MAG_MS6]
MRRHYKNIPINTSRGTHEMVFRLICDLPSDAKIVDLPSGAGAFTKRLKDQGYDHVLAVDISNEMQIEHAQFVQGDMTEALAIEDNSIDAVVCIDGIEHISRQFDFVGEVYRILRPGGIFVFSTPNITSLRSRWRWFWTGHHNKAKRPLSEENPNPSHHIALLSFTDARYLLHTRGLRIEYITTNRIKLISWPYLMFYPVVVLLTGLIYRKEKENQQRSINANIRKQMLSLPVLLGETMIIKARKNKSL